MRVLVVQNPNAGPDEVHLDALIETLTGAGHEARTSSKSAPDLRRALAFAPDLVIAAGGDGTLTAVARELIGSPTPVVPVPVGTANNLASFLGVRRDPLDAIASGRPRPCDAGVCSFEDEERFFFEAAGLGAFAEVIARLSIQPSDLPREEELQRDVRALAEVAAGIPACACRVELDGEELRGRFVMIEVMNIGMIGPRLLLAPGADPADGLLDVTAIAEPERPRLLAYLTARLHDPAAPAPFPSRRAARVRLRAEAPARFHIDDRASAAPVLTEVVFTARQHAVSFLV